VVQKEINRKTRIYGTVGLLSAIVLVSLIYVFGSSPAIFPPTETPPTSGMNTFSSYEALKEYLVDNSQGFYSYRGGPLDMQFFGDIPPTPAPAPADMGFIGTTESNSYSTTNIQVSGVDEADIVKTDGEFIYLISSATYGVYYANYYPNTARNNTVYIIKADPQDPRVVSKITLEDNTVPAGLFLSEDSTKLVVLASRYQVYDYDSPRSDVAMLMPYQSDVHTFINVYDVSDKALPVLARNFTISGSYFNSRMIGNYVYAVISQPANVFNEEVALPRVYDETKLSNVEPSNIYYADVVEPTYFTFTTFVGLNISDEVQQLTNMTILMGGASNMYVSQDNMYVTYPTWNEGQYTSIYRIRIIEDSLVFEAKGSVPGYVLNQYSMDEHGEYFRVATNWNMGTQMNNVYVLNMNMTIVGKLENLAKNEDLHSVRFMGDKCYLVTFEKIDPLFVIDLSQPANPKVLGELKIPGYSDYLHPYDENHLIGVGKETVEAEEGDFAWYQGVKLSLFDVSDVTDPKQLSKYVIGDRGTDSPVLTDPKAFLFDKAKNLLVIPVAVAEINKDLVAPGPSAHGTMVWQGVYVFRLTVNEGFVLEGRVTQIEMRNIVDPYGNTYYSDDLWMNRDYWINRALYIGNTLYTVSNGQVKLNNLDTMALIAEVNLL